MWYWFEGWLHVSAIELKLLPNSGLMMCGMRSDKQLFHLLNAAPNTFQLFSASPSVLHVHENEVLRSQMFWIKVFCQDDWKQIWRHNKGSHAVWSAYLKKTLTHREVTVSVKPTAYLSTYAWTPLISCCDTDANNKWLITINSLFVDTNFLLQDLVKSALPK